MSRFPFQALDTYWQMWNTREMDDVRPLLDRSVTEDFVFCDPVHWHVGRDALEANVRALRAEEPDADFVFASGVDHHHNRYRYEWTFGRRGRVLLRGTDITTLDEATGLIERIDGFFGPIPSLETD